MTKPKEGHSEELCLLYLPIYSQELQPGRVVLFCNNDVYGHQITLPTFSSNPTKQM